MIKGFINKLEQIALEKFADPKKILESQNYWNRDDSKAKVLIGANIIAEKSAKPEMVDPDRWPVTAPRMTSRYGWRTLNINGKSIRQFHTGIDLGGVNNVYCVEDVIVKKTLSSDKKYPCRFEWDAKKKTWIDLIKSGRIPADRSWTPYIICIGLKTNAEYWHYHIEPAVSTGQILGPGTLLGKTGNFGYTMGPHLHWEVQVRGKAVDPIEFMKKFKIEMVG